MLKTTQSWPIYSNRSEYRARSRQPSLGDYSILSHKSPPPQAYSEITSIALLISRSTTSLTLPSLALTSHWYGHGAITNPGLYPTSGESSNSCPSFDLKLNAQTSFAMLMKRFRSAMWIPNKLVYIFVGEVDTNADTTAGAVRVVVTVVGIRGLSVWIGHVAPGEVTFWVEDFRIFVALWVVVDAPGY